MAAGAVVLALFVSASADATDGTFERTWGKDVIAPGAPGDLGTGFEICTVAANCQFGDNGPLGGELRGPDGVAVDALGNVYVADSNNHRIQKFDSSGNFLLTWGKDVIQDTAPSNVGMGFEICSVAADCKRGDNTGTFGGELDFPSDVDVDGSGNVYVADSLNGRVQRFDSSGSFERAWGSDVNLPAGGTGPETCTVADNCKAGEVGTEGGEFNSANGVAADEAGNVYVADSQNNRIQRFDSSGGFTSAWGRNVRITGVSGFEICTMSADCKAGDPGALGGEFGSPFSLFGPLDVDAAGGSVYVTDAANDRIQKFDTAGSFERTWGRNVDSTTAETGFEVCAVAANCKLGDASTGLGGEFALPDAVAADAIGNVYIGDNGNDRIEMFDSSGAFLRAWGKDVVTGGSTGFEICTLAASCKPGDDTGGLGGEFINPSGVGADAAGKLYVGDFHNHRVQLFGDVQPPPPPVTPVTPTVPLVPLVPSNAFTVGKVKGKLLVITTSAAGTVAIADAAAAAGSSSAIVSAKRPGLKPSSASGGPGAISVRLRLTKAATATLNANGKVKVRAKITFTPNGGTANTQIAKLTIKKRK